MPTRVCRDFILDDNGVQLCPHELQRTVFAMITRYTLDCDRDFLQCHPVGTFYHVSCIFCTCLCVIVCGKFLLDRQAIISSSLVLVVGSRLQPNGMIADINHNNDTLGGKLR
jgi:hypothetical protein